MKKHICAVSGNRTRVPLVTSRVCYHCTITTTLLATEQSVKLVVSRGVPRRLIIQEQDIHRIIQG